MDENCGRSTSILQCLLSCWIKAWNEGDAPGTSDYLDAVFAEGPKAIDVTDDVFGTSIIVTNIEDYKQAWRRATQDISRLTFALEEEPDVSIAGDRADIHFVLKASGTRNDGAPIAPEPRWRGLHIWRQIDGEWRIVRERLMALAA